MTDPKPDPAAKRTWTEEIEVAGDQLVASVKRWAAEGKVRRVRIAEPDGDLILDVPLTIGAAPALAAGPPQGECAPPWGAAAAGGVGVVK